MNILDRLLENIYYEGQKKFSQPFSKPFTSQRPGQVAIGQGVGIKSPSEVAPAAQGQQPTPPTTPVQEPLVSFEREQTQPWMPKASVMPKLEAQQVIEAEQTAGKANSRELLLEKIRAKLPAEKPKPSFWSKLFSPVAGALTWVEKIDATTYGLVRGIGAAALTGKTLEKEMKWDNKEKSIWQAAQDYTHGLKTYEQFLGELVVSPFNLIPTSLLLKLTGGTANRVARMTSFIARTQVEGATTFGTKALTKTLGYTPSSLRSRATSRTSEYMIELLGAKSIRGTNALKDYPKSEVMGITKRLKALAEGDTKELSKIFPDKQLNDYLNLPETREVRAYLNKAIQKGTLDLDAYEAPIIAGMPRTTAQVEADILFSVQRAAAPLTRGTRGGALFGGGIIAGAINPLYDFARYTVRNLTPMLLLTRPAFTAYNQMTNFYMLMERHSMGALKSILNPKMMKIEAGKFWSVVDAPTMVREGMGFSYLAALEALEQGEEMLGALEKAKGMSKTLPLFGMGNWRQSVVELKNMYKNTPISQRPILERIIPKLHSWDAWTRGVNVASEEYFRSATFFFTFRKTYDAQMKSWTKMMGIRSPGLHALSTSDNLEKFVSKELPIAPKDLMSMEGLSPATKARLELAASELKEGHTIEDVLNLQTPKFVDDEAKVMKNYVDAHGDFETINESLDDLVLGGPEDKELLDALAASSPRHQAFVKKVQAREWAKMEKRVDEITGPHTEAEQVLRDKLLKVKSAYGNRILLINTKYQTQITKYKEFAKAKGSEVLQSDVQHIYDKLFISKFNEFEACAKRYKEILDQIEKVKIEHGGVLSIGDVDDFFKTDASQFEAVFKQHGLDPDIMTGKKGIQMSDMVELWKSQELKSLNTARNQTLLNWESRMKETFPEYLTASDMQKLHNAAKHYSYREGVRTMENDYFNYGTRNNIDFLMSTVSPYPFWQTRFVMHFATRILDNPKQLNAMFILVNKWSDATKDLPSFLMSSPINLTLDDGGQVRFSPYQFFFPLGYGITSITKYSDQAQDAGDAISQIQDMVGGYLMPYWEIEMGLASNFGMPFSKSRGTGMARQPAEVIKDIVPQLKLLRGFMGFSPAATEWAYKHDMFTEGEIVQTVRAIGDALNSGELTDKAAAQEAVNALYDRRSNSIAIKYLNKVLQGKLITDSARYMGMPISYWSPESQRTWEAQKTLYPENTSPPDPEVRKKLLDAYPGLEIIRGNIVPAGLNKDQEKRWKAAREYYATSEIAGQERDDKLTQLQSDFDTPALGATVTAAEYMDRRKRIYSEYYGSLQVAQARAAQLGAPISAEDREAFWLEVGRKIFPRHPLDDVIEQYFSIESADYIAPDGGADWEGFFADRESFMAELAPWVRKWLEKYLDNPERPDYDYLQAQKLTRDYWNLKQAMITRDPDLEYIMQNIEYWGRVNQEVAAIFKKAPKYKSYSKTLELLRKRMRKQNPELNAALVKYWGYSEKIEQATSLTKRRIGF